MRREYSRTGWFIYSGGKLWDDLAYPSEAAARATAELCRVPDATITQGQRQSVIFDNGRQSSRRLLFDRKHR